MKCLVTVGTVILGLTASAGAPVFADSAPSIVVIDSATPAAKLALPNPDLHIGEPIVFNDDILRRWLSRSECGRQTMWLPSSRITRGPSMS